MNIILNDYVEYDWRRSRGWSLCFIIIIFNNEVNIVKRISDIKQDIEKVKKEEISYNIMKYR